MRTLCILNPRSGGGRTGRTFRQISKSIQHFLPQADIQMTFSPGHGIQLARRAAKQGVEQVVAIGGDGTLNEVVNGLMLAREFDQVESLPCLALFPQGTGGDFRRTWLGTQGRPADYLAYLQHPDTHTLDVGKAEYTDHNGQSASRYFVNVLSVGLGGLVDQYMAKQSRRFGGTTAYFLASAKALQNSAQGRLQCKATLQLPGEEAITRSFALSSRNLAICNGQFFGGGMQIAPMASPQDGCFEVVNFAAQTKLQMLSLGRTLYEGDHLKLPHVQHFPASALTIELRNPAVRSRFLIDIDGESLGQLPLRVTIHPQALQMKGPFPLPRHTNKRSWV